MDRTVIERAKREAKRRVKSLSRLFAGYFQRLDGLRGEDDNDLPAITRRPRGIAAGRERTEEDHRRHLEEKHR